MAIPIACAVLAVFACAATGLSERSSVGTPFEDVLYGFFFRSYPLFLFAVVYGLAHILTAAAASGGPRAIARAVAAAVAVTLFALACFYPTFGGVVLRAGYAVGSMSFLRGQSATAAYILGTGAAGAVFATALGLGAALARARSPAWARLLGALVAQTLALWAGALLLVAPRHLGLDVLGGFPVRPLGWGEAVAAAALVALAALPHALVAARGR